MANETKQDTVLHLRSQIEKSSVPSEPATAPDATSVASDPVKPEPVEPAAVAPEAAESESAPDDGAPIAKKPHNPAKKIGSLTRKVSERDREIGRLQAELQAAQQRAAPQAQQPNQSRPQVPREPAREQFATDLEYLDARADWRADQRIAQRDLQTRQQQEQQRQEKWEKEFLKGLDELDERIPGAKSAVASREFICTKHMFDAIQELDRGPEVSYYLSQHPDEAAAIAQKTTSAGQAAAIGRIEARLEAPKPIQQKTVSKAPAPPPNISGGSSSERDPSRMSMEETAARVREKALKRRTG